MSKFAIRRMRKPEDFAAVAPLLNMICSEPTTAAHLKEEDDQIPPGKLHYNVAGKLMGWDRPQWIAEDPQGRVVAYSIAWRAPWTEPGVLHLTLVVHPEMSGKGIGGALMEEIHHWAAWVKASRLLGFIRETDRRSLAFAEHRGYEIERHLFESVLDLASFDRYELNASIGEAERAGIRFVTLAEEPGEASERKLYELYKATHEDIPGYTDSFPPFGEWRKWSIGKPGVRPEWVHLAKDGDAYVGVATLLQNEQTRAMVHEYTGVLPNYRDRHIALSLKMLGLQTARSCGAPYLRTHNDSQNSGMLHINRDLMGFRAEPGLYRVVRELG